jgi:hypothetical protein
MPFKDPAAQAAYRRAYQKRRYAEDPTYREARKTERRVRGKAKYQADPALRVSIAEKQRVYSKQPLVRERRSAYARKYVKTYDHRKLLLSSAKKRAEIFGMPFDLTVDDVTTPERCPVLGIELVRGTGRATDQSPSIDRLNPNLGYVRGNVAVISWRANRIKNNGTADEHEAVARYIRART